jgi:hypothetical protein
MAAGCPRMQKASQPPEGGALAQTVGDMVTRCSTVVAHAFPSVTAHFCPHDFITEREWPLGFHVICCLLGHRIAKLVLGGAR